ncbi:MAG: tetratricopeptide repeat protein [Gammaproteobacteria bacterium]|nr:tetratricopeptide repeat protein [Gammaproteobacteria bacterium]
MEASPAVFDIDLRSFAQDVVERSKQVPVVVLFWTDQVPPSVDTRQALERLAGQYQGKFALGLSDIAQDQALAQQLRVQGIPAIRVIKDGQLAEQMEGPQGESVLRELIDRLTMSSGEVLKESLARHLEREDWDAALRALQQAIDEEPNNPAFKVEWADILAIQGDVEGARTVLATIPEDAAERERPAARLQVAEEAADMGDLEAALAGVTADESDLEARYRAAILLAEARRYEEALEQAMTILATDRDFREDAGRVTMIRIMTLLGKGSEVATRYRRRMFNFMH